MYAHSSFHNTYKSLGVILLVIQQSMMPLIVRTTRLRQNAFISTVNVFLLEVIKLLFCSAVMIAKEGSVKKFLRDLNLTIWRQKLETAKVCVPSMIYMLQNNLYYIAMSNLEPTTYCVIYQFRILTIALLWRIFFKKPLSKLQWISLLFLTFGIALVQLQYDSTTSPKNVKQNVFLGFIAVFSMTLTTAFAGVYMEKVLKHGQLTVWLQNIRLSLFGVVVSGMIMVWTDSEAIGKDGFFTGYDWLVWLMTVLNSAGGILVSMVMLYANNILKAYAQSTAIIGAGIGSWIIFGFQPGVTFIVGTVVVLFSVITYTRNPFVNKKDIEV